MATLLLVDTDLVADLETARTDAEASASEAATSATTAATEATAAATEATNAATSAAAATTQAGNAATSATTATTQATNAATQATNAATSATAAATAKTAAEAAQTSAETAATNATTEKNAATAQVALATTQRQRAQYATENARRWASDVEHVVLVDPETGDEEAATDAEPPGAAFAAAAALASATASAEAQDGAETAAALATEKAGDAATSAAEAMAARDAIAAGAYGSFEAVLDALTYVPVVENGEPKIVGDHAAHASNDGSDANAGTRRLPKATLGALTTGLASGESVGLERGSAWREEINLSALASGAVAAYNTSAPEEDASAPPEITAADVLPTSGWATSATRGDAHTAVYSRAVTTNVPAQPGKAGWWSVWQVVDGSPVLLRRVTNLALCQSTPGSYYAAQPPQTGGGVTPETLYVHPLGSVAASTVTLEVAVRNTAIRANSNPGTGAQVGVYGVVARGNLYDNGGLMGNEIRRSAALDGTKHNAFLTTAPDAPGFAEDSVAWGHVYDTTTGFATMWVSYEDDPTASEFTYRRCLASGQWEDAGVTGFYSHGAVATAGFRRAPYEGCAARYLQVGFSAGGAADFIVEPDPVTGLRPYIVGVRDPIYTTDCGNVVVRGAIINGMPDGSADFRAYRRLYPRGSTGSVLIEETCIAIESYRLDGVIFNEAGSAPVTVSRVSIHISNDDTSSFQRALHLTSPTAVLALDRTVTSQASSHNVYMNGATAVYTGNNNVFWQQRTGSSVRFQYRSTICTSLSAWQAATGQDANSVYCKTADQAGANAFWLGVALGENAGPEDGDFRINPVAWVYDAAGTKYVGTFPDATPLTSANVGDPDPITEWPTLPETVEEAIEEYVG